MKKHVKTCIFSRNVAVFEQFFNKMTIFALKLVITKTLRLWNW